MRNKVAPFSPACSYQRRLPGRPSQWAVAMLGHGGSVQMSWLVPTDRAQSLLQANSSGGHRGPQVARGVCSESTAEQFHRVASVCSASVMMGGGGKVLSAPGLASVFLTSAQVQFPRPALSSPVPSPLKWGGSQIGFKCGISHESVSATVCCCCQGRD